MTTALLRLFAGLALLGLGCSPALAAGLGAGSCSLNPSQDEKTWPFDVEFVAKAPVWSAERGAAELYKIQTKYISNKNSPLAKNQIPPELGYYFANFKVAVQPFVTYSPTIDGRQCAKVVGAKVVVTLAPEVLLAKELGAQSCVAKSALSHQLLHHDATAQALKEMLASKEDVRSLVFPTYATQGAAGKTREEVSLQLATMEKAATASLQSQLAKGVLDARRRQVITKDIFAQLYESCQGEFEKASGLAQSHGSHE